MWNPSISTWNLFSTPNLCSERLEALESAAANAITIWCGGTPCNRWHDSNALRYRLKCPWLFSVLPPTASDANGILGEAEKICATANAVPLVKGRGIHLTSEGERPVPRPTVSPLERDDEARTDRGLTQQPNEAAALWRWHCHVRRDQSGSG